ncbi:hypothetical protein FRC19_004350 [Serendipita sp. 401]|nr:hypothetical protein FRC19_004350 [Serendipita sp. 401]KAG9036305.1 hypothetical protein FS842_003455 [Serendipita sp. 407]
MSTPPTNVQDEILPGDGAGTELARSQTFLGAFYHLTEELGRCLRTHEHDVQRLESQEPPIRRLLASVHNDRLRIPESYYDYLYKNLNKMLSIIREKISQAQDRPDQPIQELVSRIQTRRRGRPRLEIQPDFLAVTLQHRTPAHVSTVLRASARTISRRAVDYGIRPPGLPVAVRVQDESGRTRTTYPGRKISPSLSDGDLDSMMQEALSIFPDFGREMLRGHFRGRGHQVSRARIRASFERVNGAGAEFGRPRIQRRVYTVSGPNSLWHHDGHHSRFAVALVYHIDSMLPLLELIHWKIVIHCFIDGFSRLVVGIQATDNNRAETVLQLFHNAIHQFGRPSRIRGDYGVENVAVAEDQERAQGFGRGSYIYGPSKANSRIERLWVDVGKGFARKWANLFRDLEQSHGLNVDLESHLWLLHYLFLASINQDAVDWGIAWNNHGMQLPHGQRSGRSPVDQFVVGMAENGMRGLEDTDPAYGQDPVNYGVNWEDMEDAEIMNHLQRRREEARNSASHAFEETTDIPHNSFVHPHNNPPRWSRVTVQPPHRCPLTDEELQEFENFIQNRPEQSGRSMDSNRRLWILTLQKATELMDRRG